ncbi:putative serine/threonine-protein kinase PkwA [Smittium mucronatum]|uniref:Putative serine/threonine-protein kinase PkwA n=1 Tax=Smittium mucronatum TaxID=133383 RepID=A0A1R0GZ23_9FUNG|nr:putative serine/threonine-protein kinase PkwA [Smittium mucronatum]
MTTLDQNISTAPIASQNSTLNKPGIESQTINSNSDSDFVSVKSIKKNKNKLKISTLSPENKNEIKTPQEKDYSNDLKEKINDPDYLDPELIAIAQGRRSGRIRTKSKPFSLDYIVPTTNKKKKSKSKSKPLTKTPPSSKNTVKEIEIEDSVSNDDSDVSEFDIKSTKIKKTPKSKTSSKPSKTIKKDTKPKQKTPKAKKAAPKKPIVKPIFDPEYTKKLAQDYPDTYWKESQLAKENEGPILYIDKDHSLSLLPTSISDQSPITSIILSDDGNMLATFSSSGLIKIWDTINFELLSKIRDDNETQIEEFYSGQFTPNGSLIIAAGKLKDRHRWSSIDDDNHIMPCPVKIFDVVTGECKNNLAGHTEEVICIKRAIYKNNNYLVTTSQDGHIRKWSLSDDWTNQLHPSIEFKDGVTCMAFSVSFLPNCGNRYFIAACDERVKLFDMETEQVIQVFDPVYSSYCDGAKFIYPLDDLSFLDPEYSSENPAYQSSETAYLLTRGVELLDSEDNSVSSIPNTVTLHKLIYPSKSTFLDNPGFKLVELKRFHHENYLSNSWLIRISSNGRYVLAPTYNGQVFVFHIATGKLVSILRGHQGIS